MSVDSVSWIGAAINLPPENRAVVPATRSFAEHIHIIGEVSHAARARRDVGLYAAPTAANASVRAALG